MERAQKIEVDNKKQLLAAIECAHECEYRTDISIKGTKCRYTIFPHSNTRKLKAKARRTKAEVFKGDV